MPDLFAQILETERASERVLIAAEHWTAFVPFAARWPVEVHLLPNRHVPDLAATSTDERDELSRVYLQLLQGIDALYPTPTPYISAWHQAPVNSPPGRHPPDAADHLAASRGDEAQVPGRVRVRDGRVDRRRSSGAVGGFHPSGIGQTVVARTATCATATIHSSTRI